MFRMALRAIALAILCLGTAATAHAAALVENAVALWEGEIGSNYALMIDNLKNKKNNAAKEQAAKLQDLTVRMSGEVARIREQAAALAPELGAAWVDTEKLINNFNQRVIAARNVIGKGPVDIAGLESDWNAALGALKTSVEFTKAFGQRYGAVASGPVEEAKQLFDGYLYQGYNKTMEYLSAGNTDDGKSEIDRLVEIIARLYSSTGNASSQFGNVARVLQDGWRPVHDATYQLQEQTEEVADEVGESDFDLGDMQDAYANLNAEMVRAYKDIFEFGNRLRAISDDWS